jgi:tRNA-specific 2-thiouridylase
MLETEKGGSPGPIVDGSGKVLGRHNGIYRYTVGQHKGLGSLGRKMFVTEIRPPDNTVVVGSEDDLLVRKIQMKDAVIASGYVIDNKREYDIQVRYRGKPVKGLVSSSGKGPILSLTDPIRAIAPGQSAVIYDGEMVVGGGVIDKAE